MTTNTFYTLCCLIILTAACKNASKEPLNALVKEEKIVAYADRFSDLLNYPVDAVAFPRSADSSGQIKKVPSKDWTSGFFPGSLYMIYQLTEDKKYLNRAKEWTALVEDQKFNDKTHDMGFKIFCSFGNGYRLEKDSTYKAIIIHSAKTLGTRYNKTVGATRSWDFNKEQWQFPVIVDNMMNLELLFEATNYSGDSTYYKMADQHAKTTLKNHFRTNHSIYHVVDYDTIRGNVRMKVTHQGFNDESTWARGQGWGIYGYTMSYRYTKNPAFLEQAKNTADFFMNHPNLPEDGIPYWDFDAPKIPNEPRDASAGALVASALIELYQYTKEQKYLDFSDKIMNALSSSAYVLQKNTTIPFILDHATGNWPKNDEIDGPLNYADYYFLEALVRRKNLQ